MSLGKTWVHPSTNRERIYIDPRGLRREDHIYIHQINPSEWRVAAWFVDVGYYSALYGVESKADIVAAMVAEHLEPYGLTEASSYTDIWKECK